MMCCMANRLLNSIYLNDYRPKLGIEMAEECGDVSYFKGREERQKWIFIKCACDV